MIYLLYNKRFWLLISIAFILTFSPKVGVSLPQIGPAGIATLGVIIGAFFAAVTLLLVLFVNREMAELDYVRELLDKVMLKMKMHLLMIAGLFITFSVSVWPEAVYALLPYFICTNISQIQMSIFIQSSCILLIAFSLYEITQATFILLQIRWELLKNKNDEIDKGWHNGRR